MDKDNLFTIAEAIAAKINVERIYCLMGAENNVQSDHLILLLPPDSVGVKFTELEPFVKMVISNREDITFAMFHTGEVKSALEAGNLFFHLACSDDTLLYRKPNSPALPVATAEELLAWKNAANDRFNDGVDKTTAFMEGAEFYRDKDEIGLTVFMLHQVAELTYRALELCILTKEKRTHDIAAHQKFLTPFIPQLGLTFPADTTEERDILKTLNNAYSAVRYEQNHTVKKEHVPILFERITKLQEKSKVIVRELSVTLDIKSLNTPPIKDTSTEIRLLGLPSGQNQSGAAIADLTVAELQEILTLIVEHLSPDQIYLFGNKLLRSERASLFALDQNCQSGKLHFDLLVISSVPNPYNNIQSLVNKNADKVTLNLLIHSQKEAVKRLQGDNNENRNRFFETVFRDGLLLYSKTPFFDRTAIQSDNHLIHEHAAPYCKIRFQRGLAFLDASRAIKGNLYEVELALLSQGVEQVCLGLIYAFWGYIPNHHSLTHLLDICKTFLPNGEMYLPGQTDYKRSLFSLLCNSHSSVRFSVGKPIGANDFEDLRLRCTGFIEYAANEGFREVEVLGYHPINEVQNVNFNISI